MCYFYFACKVTNKFVIMQMFFCFCCFFAFFIPIFRYFLLCQFCPFPSILVRISFALRTSLMGAWSIYHFRDVTKMVLTFVHRHAQKSGKPFLVDYRFIYKYLYFISGNALLDNSDLVVSPKHQLCAIHHLLQNR